MYDVDWKGARVLPSLRGVWPRVNRNVWALGLTSFFTDFSSEMVTAVLPVYLVAYRGFSFAAFGAIDGLHQGVSALVRWLGGASADRSRRYAEVAGLGYALSAVCKLGWLVSGATLGSAALLVGLDRVGKGIRTAPRDALISLSTARDSMGRAFGVHRGLDAGGAMLGPLAAFVILAFAPYRFDAVFLLSFGVAIVGVGVLLGFVKNVSEQRERQSDLLRDTRDLIRDPHFRRIVLAGSALALVTMSDPFVYLALQQQVGFAPHAVPLLFVGTSLGYLVLAVPVGHLADRIGGGIIFLAGHLVLLAAYGTLLTPGLGSLAMWICPALLGTYYAATDGVLPAMASLQVAGRLRGNGLALLGTAISLSRLTASLVLGWIWSNFTRETAVFSFMAGLAVMIVPVGLVLAKLSQHRS